MLHFCTNHPKACPHKSSRFFLWKGTLSLSLFFSLLRNARSTSNCFLLKQQMHLPSRRACFAASLSLRSCFSFSSYYTVCRDAWQLLASYWIVGAWFPTPQQITDELLNSDLHVQLHLIALNLLFSSRCSLIKKKNQTQKQNVVVFFL